MGTIAEVSVIKGARRNFSSDELLHRIIEENIAGGCGNKPALIFNTPSVGESKVSYSMLNCAANKIASGLIDVIRHRELQPNNDGDYIVAVCMQPTDELITALLAILKMGAAYLPIDPTFPSNRVEHILKEAKPVCVIYDDTCVDRSLFGGDILALSFAQCMIESNECSDANISDERMLSSGYLGLVLYTSGSTGVPKGVRMPHSIIMNRLRWQWERFPYTPTETIGVFKTALTFVDSISEIWGPLLSENAVLVVPKYVTKDPTQLVAILQKYEIERLVLVPTLLKSLLIYLWLKRDSSLLHRLKLWVCSGEILPVSLANEFFDYFGETGHLLCNFYGSTEITGDITYFVCENKEQIQNYINVPIGKPIFNTIIYILDSIKNPVKIGMTGELFVAGANLAHGYVNGRDKERFVDNPLAVDPKFARLYRTGDFASVNKAGIVQYEGRSDSQIKIRGHRVDLSEIEKHLLELNGIDKGIVLCYHAGQIDQTILAFAAVKSSSTLHEMQIENLLRQKLPEYMTPQVIVIENVPLLVNGKIDRQTLLKMYENANNNDDPQIVIDYDYSGVSQNELQMTKLLFETIGEVIGRSTRMTISLKSNFYELGGNSLNSIFTVARLREKGYFIEVSDFIAAKNLREMLAHINENGPSDQCLMKNVPKFTAVQLAMEHKSETIRIITNSFIEKAELEQQLKPNLSFADYEELLEAIWNPLIEKAYSFIVKDETNRIIGVALNFDAHDEPEPPLSGALQTIFTFLDYVETPIKKRLPSDRPIMHSFMMGTHENLDARENIAVMTFMENEVIRLAKKKKCAGVLTTNTNALTQQLARDVYGYKTLLDYQVNEYELDGVKPFGTAPDHYRAIVQWKEL